PGVDARPQLMFSSAEIEELRGALAQRRREAEERLASLEGPSEAIVQATARSNVDDKHEPDGATVALERSQIDALARSARAELEEVHAAYERIDAGTYGVCEGCGQAIPLARLRVRPTARTCVTCASRI